MRRSSSRTPSGRVRSQSPPPGKTLPRSRGPSKVPPVIGAITRVPCGTAPSFCGGGTTTWSVISRLDVIGHLERRLEILPPPRSPRKGGRVRGLGKDAREAHAGAGAVPREAAGEDAAGGLDRGADRAVA